jgi:hypothetical protein
VVGGLEEALQQSLVKLGAGRSRRRYVVSAEFGLVSTHGDALEEGSAATGRAQRSATSNTERHGPGWPDAGRSRRMLTNRTPPVFAPPVVF